MKLQNNIVSDSEMEITFDSFNPTAGRLADCLLGFSIQVQLTLVLALSRHTQGHTATATTQGLQRSSGQAQAACRAAGPGHAHASGDREVIASMAIAWTELRKCTAAGRSIDGGSESVTLAGLHSFLFSSIFGLQFASYRA